MRRRDLIALLGGAAAWPLVARAQQSERMRRVGVLETTPLELNASNFDAFRRTLGDLGYREGQSLMIEYRSADGGAERFGDLVADLLRLNVDVIVTRGTPAVLAAKQATTTIPIVMAAIGEPLAVISSLAHPTGNITGLSSYATDLTAKRTEVIRRQRCSSAPTR